MGGGVCMISSSFQNPEIFICILYLATICSDSASYFIEMCTVIILVGIPDSNKNGAGLHHISWYRAKEGSICLSYVKNQNVNVFSTVNYCFGFFSLLLSSLFHNPEILHIFSSQISFPVIQPLPFLK